MTGHPYHHGGLRAALLARAESTLRDSGVEGLSLRELAREIGVSHGAPRRHFLDKAALLDALAIEGFGRLDETLAQAAELESRTDEDHADEDHADEKPADEKPADENHTRVNRTHDHRAFGSTLTDVAVAYVRFATDNPALVELMFTHKHRADASAELQQAANAGVARVTALVELGQSTEELVDGDVQSIAFVLFATLQGIAALANTDMVDKGALDELTTYAVDSLLGGLTPR